MTARFRPAGHPLDWASDLAFDDAGEAWDAEPNTLAPSAGYVAQGHMPERRRPVEYDNHLFRDMCARLAYLDMLELNFFVGGEAPTVSGGVAGFMASGNNSPIHPLYFVADGTIIQQSADAGGTWTTVHTDAGAVIRDVAASEKAFPDAVVCTVATEGGDAKVIYKFAIGGWTTTALSASDDCRVIQWHPWGETTAGGGYHGNVFYVGGLNGATPRVWKVDFLDPITSPPTQTILSAGAGANRIDQLALGPSMNLAAVLGVAGPTNVLYAWSSPTATALDARTAPTSDVIRDVFWSPADEAFYLVTDAELWTSPDGADGSWVDLSGNLPSGVTFAARCACVRGSLITLVCDSAGVALLLVSGDGGLSWEILPDLLAKEPFLSMGSPPVLERVHRIGNRLAATGDAGSGNIGVIYGLRVGRIV